MVLINRILTVLVLIVGIVALGFAWKLGKHREELRNRGNAMAVGVADMVKELDTNSGTKLSEKVTVEQNGAAGTLGVKNFSQLSGLLKEARDLATKVRTQRDALAKSLSEVAKGFNIEMSEDSFRGPDAEANIVKLGESLNAIRQQSRAVAEAMVNAAKLLGANLDLEAIAKPEGQGALKDAVNTMQTTLRQNEDLRGRLQGALQRIVQKLGDQAQVRGPDIIQARQNDVETLVTAIGQLSERAARLDQAKNEIETLKDQMGKLTNQLEQLTKNATNLDARYKKLDDEKKIVDALLKECREGYSPRGGAGESANELHGRIVEVNYNFNYVLIDLGNRNRLPANARFTVYRGSEYICTVEVSKVYDSYCVADILNDLKQGEAIKGDEVYMSAR